MKSFPHILLSLLLIPATLFAANPAVMSERESGIYAAGETVRWNIDTTAWPDGVKNLRYRIKTGGVRQIKEGGSNSTITRLLLNSRPTNRVGSALRRRTRWMMARNSVPAPVSWFPRKN